MRPHRLLAAFLAVAFSTPAVAADLKLATWNLEWLTLRQAGDPALPADVQPKTAGDIARLRGYADRLAADVVAFQEVDGAEAASRVFPPDRYSLAVTRDAVVQRVGFAVRNGLIWSRNPDLVGLDVTADGSQHLRSGADITLEVGGTVLRLLAVHLKSGCQRQSLNNGSRPCSQLSDQVTPLQGWIAQRRAEGVPFVILGDFNRVMDGRDQLLDALERGGPLARATAGRANPVLGRTQFHRPHPGRRRRARLDAAAHPAGPGLSGRRAGLAAAAVGSLPGIRLLPSAGRLIVPPPPPGDRFMAHRATKVC